MPAVPFELPKTRSGYPSLLLEFFFMKWSEVMDFNITIIIVFKLLESSWVNGLSYDRTSCSSQAADYHRWLSGYQISGGGTYTFLHCCWWVNHHVISHCIILIVFYLYWSIYIDRWFHSGHVGWILESTQLEDDHMLQWDECR